MWNAVKVATPAASLPVSVSDAKAWLRVDTATEDSVIEAMVRAAIARIDGPSGIGWAMMAQTWALSLDEFPDTILLPGAPVKSVTSISYVDTAGAAQTLDESTYRVDISMDQARITPAYGQAWPAIRQITGAVTVTYVVGEASAANVPADLKAAVNLLTAHLYENREASTVQSLTVLPLGVEYMIRDYRRLMVTV